MSQYFLAGEKLLPLSQANEIHHAITHILYRKAEFK